MKANELQIGDLVIRHIGDYANPYGEIEFRINDCFDLADFAKCTPIPLTTEILEKNGFELMISGNTYAYGDFRLGVNRYGEFDISIARSTYQIVYVHELQHALRLCGLSELADNFKI